jgi:hypothetical protein
MATVAASFIDRSMPMPDVIQLFGGEAQFKAHLDATMTHFFQLYNLEGWQFRIDKAKTRAGICNYAKREICLSRYFLASQLVNYASFYNIILHEIAHAITPGHGHDIVWQAVARGMGCDGNTHCAPFCNHKYIGMCKCQDRKHFRHQLKARCMVICKNCKSEVIFDKMCA